MAGILNNAYYYFDESNLLIEFAHHEAGHALRGHSLGLSLASIHLSSFIHGKTLTSFAGDLSLYPAASHVQIGMAGPAVTLRFIQDKEIWFTDRGKVLGQREEDDDLMEAIHDIMWEDDAGNIYKYYQLTADTFPDLNLIDSDDFSRVFDIMLTEHYNRYSTIARVRTLLKHYRRHEQMATAWVDENWQVICDLAAYVLAHEKLTHHYTHRLPGKKFHSWVRRVGKVREAPACLTM